MSSATTTRTQRIDNAVAKKLNALLEKEASLRGSAAPHSQHEAEATARAIQRLLLRHHLSLTDLELSQAKERNPVDAELFSPEEHGIPQRRRRIFWQEELAAIVAEAHLCGLLVVPGSNVVFFVGRAQDRAVCILVYALLLEFAERESAREAARVRSYGEDDRYPAFRTAWLRGFNLRIAQRYRELEEQMVWQSLEQNESLSRLPGGSGITRYSLMHRLSDARVDVQAWMAENVGNPEAGLVQPTVDDMEGLAAGFRAAGQAPMHAHRAIEQ